MMTPQQSPKLLLSIQLLDLSKQQNTLLPGFLIVFQTEQNSCYVLEISVPKILRNMLPQQQK